MFYNTETQAMTLGIRLNKRTFLFIKQHQTFRIRCPSRTKKTQLPFTPSKVLIIPHKNRGVAIIGASHSIGANTEHSRINRRVLIKGGLVLRAGKIMVGAPIGDLGVIPDGGKILYIAHDIGANGDETVALVEEAVEFAPVGVLGETVAGNPAFTRGTVEAVPDGGETGLVVLNVARDVDELVALADVLVKGGLVLGVGHGVAGSPGAVEGRLVPDGGIACCVVDRVAVDELEAEALVEVLVEGGLVLACVETVSGYPLGAVAGLLPDCGEPRVVVDGVSVNPRQTVALVGEVGKGRLVGGIGQAVTGLPRILRRGDDDTLRRGERVRRGQRGQGRDEKDREREHLDDTAEMGCRLCDLSWLAC